MVLFPTVLQTVFDYNFGQRFWEEENGHFSFSKIYHAETSSKHAKLNHGGNLLSHMAGRNWTEIKQFTWKTESCKKSTLKICCLGDLQTEVSNSHLLTSTFGKTELSLDYLSR